MRLELSCAAVWLVTTAVVIAGEAETASNAAAPTLQIHLPREVTVQDNLLRLGQISAIKGDPAFVAAVGTLGMGRLSVPGQRVVLDRATIRSRLASSGISADGVRLTGAERVVVRRDEKIVRAEDFLEIGQAFLRKHPPAPGVHNAVPTGKPKDLVLPRQLGDLQVTPRYVRNGARGYVTVQVIVTADGRTIAARDVPFRLKYQRRRAVTRKPVAEGDVFTPENVKIEVEESDSPESGAWRPPYGLVAQRAIAENTVISGAMIGSAQSAVVVRRNETVLIRLERPGLLVTAMGTALQEAHAGESLKVRNADSQRVIVCKVNADGSVEPML